MWFKNHHLAILTIELHKSHERKVAIQFKIMKKHNTLKFVIF